MNTPDTLYQEWANTPDSTTLNRVVDSLAPVMNYSLSSIGAFDDPVLKTRAKVFTAQAVKKYDPTSGASLATWTSSQLQQLRRAKRETQSVMSVPDRAQIDALKLRQAEQSFFDEHDREPDLLELSDFSGLPAKRIEKIRKIVRAVPSETAMAGGGPQTESDFDDEALSYVHHESDHVDRKIIEFKTGFGGSQVLDPKTLATKLRLTPSQLSRRSARIALKVNELEEALKETT